MTMENTTAHRQTKLAVRRDLGTTRNLIRRVKCSERLACLGLFGRRDLAQLLECLDRRSCYRSPVEMPIYVTPASYTGEHASPLECGETEMLAITRDVSKRGLGFLHDDPLEGDYAIVTVDLLDGAPFSLLLEVRWSNVERWHMYMSGGRFLGIIGASTD